MVNKEAIDIPLPKYHCKKHGDVDQTIDVSFIGVGEELAGKYCMICAVTLLAYHLPKIEKVKEDFGRLDICGK